MPQADAMVFSRYTHRFEKEGVTAFFHALRMLPVYMPSASAAIITGHIEKGEALPPALAGAVKRLVRAKILSPSRDFDDLVIAKARETMDTLTVKIVYFILTEACNFDCSYCHVKKETPPGHQTRAMSRETARDGVDAYARLVDTAPEARRMIILYGGEPLLNVPAIEEIVRRVETHKAAGTLPLDVELSIITNGSILNAETAAFLKTHGIQIAVSIDGGEAANSCRVFAGGGETYNAVMAGIKAAREAGCDVSLSVTLSEESLGRFDETLAFIDDAGCKEFVFNMMIANDPADSSLADRTAEALIKAYQYFRPKGIKEDRMIRKASAFNAGEIYAFDCAAAGANQIAIAPEGTIGLCHVQVGSRTGFAGHVSDVSFDPKNVPAFVEWSRRTPLNMEACHDCAALGICGGGCPYNAKRKHGSIWDMDDRFCIHAKKTLEWLIWDLFTTKIEPEINRKLQLRGDNNGVT
jgi:uncharacterized protein